MYLKKNWGPGGSWMWTAQWQLWLTCFLRFKLVDIWEMPGPVADTWPWGQLMWAVALLTSLMDWLRSALTHTLLLYKQPRGPLKPLKNTFGKVNPTLLWLSKIAFRYAPWGTAWPWTQPPFCFSDFGKLCPVHSCISSLPSRPPVIPSPALGTKTNKTQVRNKIWCDHVSGRTEDCQGSQGMRRWLTQSRREGGMARGHFLQKWGLSLNPLAATDFC
jgi:hypothetical protein